MTDTTTTNGQYRLAHTMIRVTDLKESLDFYTRMLSMQVLRSTDYPDGKFTNTFVGYGPEASYPAIELTHNWDQDQPYDLGGGWGHLAIEVPDVYETCQQLEKEGVKITRAPGPMKHGTRNIAFIEDPDGYKIELLEPLR
ncbi:MAG: lactoylglutathione lyase [Acidiferrobacterales bacterium]